MNRKRHQGFPTFRHFEPTLRDDSSVAIPITYFLDRNGKVIKKIVGGQEYADFEKVAQSALAKK